MSPVVINAYMQFGLLSINFTALFVFSMTVYKVMRIDTIKLTSSISSMLLFSNPLVKAIDLAVSILSPVATANCISAFFRDINVSDKFSCNKSSTPVTPNKQLFFSTSRNTLLTSYL